ncbi:MAG: response regulator [Armatimonadota bacterium]|nr:response regulator [Armatimonadota bacterium]
MREEGVRDARILVVDDQEANVELLLSLLRREGYAHAVGVTDPREAVDRCRDLRPDLILLDLMMPHLDGFEVMARLRPMIPDDEYLPILVLTADVTLPTRQRALAAGANDFLVKPSDATEVMLRIRNLLMTRVLHRELRRHNERLEAMVAARTRELEETHVELLERLAVAAECRDDATGQHTRRVGEHAAAIAAQVGLPAGWIETIRRAAPLHDVGKIGVPDAILLKPAGLTAAEFEVIKTHTTIGGRILAGGRYELLRTAEAVARHHHERWDGTGYPHGLRGEEIPLEARVVAVADAYDSMTHDRPYRKALRARDAWEILWGGAGTQWDASLVEALSAAMGAAPPTAVLARDGDRQRSH